MTWADTMVLVVDGLYVLVNCTATHQRRGGGQAAGCPAGPQIRPEQRCLHAIPQGI